MLAKANHLSRQSERGTPTEFHKLVAGREADFPFLEQGNPQHERARQDWSNRARYANRYFDIVLAYVAEQFRPPS